MEEEMTEDLIIEKVRIKAKETLNQMQSGISRFMAEEIIKKSIDDYFHRKILLFFVKSRWQMMNLHLELRNFLRDKYCPNSPNYLIMQQANIGSYEILTNMDLLFNNILYNYYYEQEKNTTKRSATYDK